MVQISHWCYQNDHECWMDWATFTLQIRTSALMQDAIGTSKSEVDFIATEHIVPTCQSGCCEFHCASEPFCQWSGYVYYLISLKWPLNKLDPMPVTTTTTHQLQVTSWLLDPDTLFSKPSITGDRVSPIRWYIHTTCHVISNKDAIDCYH